MRTPMQDQLLKAGLVKKHKVAEAVREQARQLHSKAPVTANAAQLETQRLQAERVERDRALSAQRNAQARASELRAQVRQIVERHQVGSEGEIAYGFNDGGKIRNVLVNETLRAQLASGALVIVRFDQGYALLPRAAAAMVYERDAAMVVLDRGRADVGRGDGDGDGDGDDDEHYRQFAVPDDLIW
ncbi:MAG: DUF2058 domain-containing protein [Pseudomonadota bacterium]|nr:DUF2058 domain-containing protein [Pseudomonadota bacterium]